MWQPGPLRSFCAGLLADRRPAAAAHEGLKVADLDQDLAASAARSVVRQLLASNRAPQCDGAQMGEVGGLRQRNEMLARGVEQFISRDHPCAVAVNDWQLRLITQCS